MANTPTPPSGTPPGAAHRPPPRNILRAANLASLTDHSLYRFFIVMSIVFILGLIGAFGWAFYERTHIPNAKFFAINQNNFIPLKPLRRPNLSNQSVIQWSVLAATACYTLNFNNYQDVIESLRQYFTEPGYDTFIAALNEQKTLTDIAKKQLIVSAVLTDSPILLSRTPGENNFEAWLIQFPMLVTFQSASEQSKKYLIVTLLVTEVPTTDSVRGIGISRFMVKERLVSGL